MLFRSTCFFFLSKSDLTLRKRSASLYHLKYVGFQNIGVIMSNSTVPPKKRGGTVPTCKLPVKPGYFFLTFNGSILTLCGFNFTCDSFFLTFGGLLTFFSHLTVPFSHCAVPTSHVTVLFSHLVVPLFFSHI